MRDAGDLAALEQGMRAYGVGASTRVRALVARLGRTRLPRVSELVRFHEALCWLRAYPHDAALLDRVERLLDAFARRPDVRRHRRSLADTGIAGTDIHYRFFWATARWLGHRWPDRLELDRAADCDWSRLAQALPLLFPFVEGGSLGELQRMQGLSAHQSLAMLFRPGETDAVAVLRRIERSPGSDFTREALHDGLDSPYVLRAGGGTPSRTGARYARSPVCFFDSPPSAERPALAAALRRPPRRVRAVSPREARTLIDLAQEAMVTRSRDLAAFAYADARDVRMVDDGDGLQFACFGVVPERRLLLPAVYAMLTLRNGVPIGYVQVDALFRAAEVAYNTFATFRGGEAAFVFGRMLATTHHLFGARSFDIEPYQLGHHNEEGLASGAFWFYFKLGFRPRDPAVRALVRRELGRMTRDPRHRSSEATLARLARRHLYWGTAPRGSLPGLPAHQHLGLAVAARLADRYGLDRDRSLALATEEARRLLGLRSFSGWSPGERLAWRHLAPILLALPALARFRPDERRAAIDVVRAKGGGRESEFVARFDGHARLANAVRRLCESTARVQRPSTRA